MKVILEIETELKPKINLGDVVIKNGAAYLATRFENKVILRSFDGKIGLNGYHNSFEELQATLEGDYKVYPKQEYELVLRRK